MYPLNVNIKLLLRLVRTIFLALVILSVVACDMNKEPIKIGYVGGLTGRVAGLGIAGRDGALFAIEEVDRAGGIDGRQVSLVVKDDKQDADTAKQAVRELIQEDVVAIVGHMTSSMSAETRPIINEAKKVMISPTSKSDVLSGHDDYFFRVTAASSFNAQKVADLAYSQKGFKTFAVIYDMNNRAFTESWLQQFRQPYEALGGKIIVTREFHSGSVNLSFLSLVKDVTTYKVDALLVLASALDTALISQQLFKLGNQLPVFASEWSFTSDLLNFGGMAVEGLTSFHSFNNDNQNQRYLDYKDKFIKRFGYDPSFASVLSYDATKLLLSAIQRNSNPKQLKKTLLEMGPFPGLQSNIKFDQYGDVERSLFLTVINNGKFRVID